MHVDAYSFKISTLMKQSSPAGRRTIIARIPCCCCTTRHADTTPFHLVQRHVTYTRKFLDTSTRRSLTLAEHIELRARTVTPRYNRNAPVRNDRRARTPILLR